MATSSIFSNIVINDPQKAEKFIEAVELSERDAERKPVSSFKKPLSDIAAIRRLMSKRISEK